MHFKLMFSRPRPVQVHPAPMPPILTRSHPSYLNPHALRSWIITDALVTVGPAMTAQLELLAKRIAENREMPACTLFREILQLAKAEWDGVADVPFPAA